jgi:mono/diheme cytochrome c family protein
MKTKLYVVLGILVIILSYGFRKNNIANTEKNYLPISKDLKITGNQLFQNNCAVCHGTDRKGNSPTFPSLVNIHQKLSKNQIGELLQTGRNIMPNFSHLSSSERNAIIGFLYGEPTESIISTEITSVEKGKNLFIANCVRCHQQDDSQVPRQWGMKPPKLNGVSDWVNISQFKQILNMGTCYMPSFAAMEDKNKEDIYAYLSTLKSSYQNSNYGTRKGCGMRMR